jgi:hypothetical protein
MAVRLYNYYCYYFYSCAVSVSMLLYTNFYLLIAVNICVLLVVGVVLCSLYFQFSLHFYSAVLVAYRPLYGKFCHFDM